MTKSAPIDQKSIRRIEGLLGWWGMRDLLELTAAEAAKISPPVLLLRLIKLSNEALTSQARELTATGETVALALPVLAGTRQASQLTVEQLNLLVAATEALASHAQAWAEATRTLRDCCATLAGDAGCNVHQSVDRDALGERAADVARRADRQSSTFRSEIKPKRSQERASPARGPS